MSEIEDPYDLPGLNLEDFANPNCPHCHGSGYLGELDGGALPRQRVCRCVREGRRLAAADARILSLFGEGGSAMTIGSYQTGGYPENETALRCAKNYVLSWPEFRDAGQGFALQGEPGSGKTHLSTGVLIALIKKWNVKPFHLSVPEMLRLARKKFDDPSVGDVLDKAMKAEIYLLDDIGAEYHRVSAEGTSWVDEQLFVILNHRLTQRLPTIYTTNLKRRELGDRLDQRVARRLDSATLAFLPMRTVAQAAQPDKDLRKLLLS